MQYVDCCMVFEYVKPVIGKLTSLVRNNYSSFCTLLLPLVFNTTYETKLYIDRGRLQLRDWY